jgi:hypothetical protein
MLFTEMTSVRVFGDVLNRVRVVNDAMVFMQVDCHMSDMLGLTVSLIGSIAVADQHGIDSQFSK